MKKVLAKQVKRWVRFVWKVALATRARVRVRLVLKSGNKDIPWIAVCNHGAEEWLQQICRLRAAKHQVNQFTASAEIVVFTHRFPLRSDSNILVKALVTERKDKSRRPPTIRIALNGC